MASIAVAMADMLVAAALNASDASFSTPTAQDGTTSSFFAAYIFGPISSLLLSNQFLSGGLLLTLFYYFVEVFRSYLNRTIDYLHALCFVSLTIHEKEEVFELVAEWLSAKLNGEMKGERVEKDITPGKPSLDVRGGAKVRRLVGKSVRRDPYEEDPYYDRRMDSAEGRRPKLVFVPDQGEYDIYVDGTRIHVTCGANTQQPANDNGGRGSKKAESIITLTAWSPAGDTSILRKIVQTAVIESHDQACEQTLIYAAYYDRWRRISASEPRPFDSVILKKGLKEDLVEDITLFQSSAKWYKSTGVPYRRGILLYGPPGCGKSSFIVALAGHLKLSVCLLSLASPIMTDQMLGELMVTAPPASIILLEDVDAAFPPQDDCAISASPMMPGSGGMKVGQGSTVTLSGLLNAIDGIAAQEGSIVILTTNHPERLPPALLRPGRVDKPLLFDRADRDQVRRMFLKFFPKDRYPDDDVETCADEISERIEEGSLTTAQLQGMFMGCRLRGPRAVLDELEGWLKEQAEEEGRLAKMAEESKVKVKKKDDVAEDKKKEDAEVVGKAEVVEIRTEDKLDLSDSVSEAGSDNATVSGDAKDDKA